MTIEEFTKLYYPTKQECEVIALKKLVKDYCGSNDRVIFNALRRGGIKTIKDLHIATESEIKNIRNVGKERTDCICRIKASIDLKLQKYD